SCSVIMPSWSDGEGGGAIHQSLTQLLGDGTHPSDMICCASAGNTAQRHWAGSFHAAHDGWHEWTHGIVDNEVVPWGSDPVSIELCWSAAADFDLRVFDTATHQEIGCSLTQPRAGRRCAVVQFDPNGGRTYQVRVRQTRGNPSTFHLVPLGGSLRHATPKCSIPFPGDGPEVIAVGAVDAVGHRVAYSSCGPI